MIQPAFHRGVISRMLGHVVAANEILLAKWLECAASHTEINVTQDMSDVTLNIVLRSIFDVDLPSLMNADGSNPFALLTEETERNLTFAYKFRSLSKLIMELVNRRRASSESRDDLLAMLISARDRKSDEPMPDKQLLHIVIGGELKDVQDVEFRDLSRVEFVGAFPNYAEAHKAWKSKAQSTVDNALMRYFIIHAHKLLSPDADFLAAVHASMERLLPTLPREAIDAYNLYIHGDIDRRSFLSRVKKVAVSGVAAAARALRCRCHSSMRTASESIGRIMPYNWIRIAERLAGAWMAYSSMLDDFAREVANAAKREENLGRVPSLLVPDPLRAPLARLLRRQRDPGRPVGRCHEIEKIL